MTSVRFSDWRAASACRNHNIRRGGAGEWPMMAKEESEKLQSNARGESRYLLKVRRAPQHNRNLCLWQLLVADLGRGGVDIAGRVKQRGLESEERGLRERRGRRREGD